eukprot:11985421-Ditylum_brightwellii.AAC.1
MALDNFDHNIKRFNKWVKDKRTIIVKDVGASGGIQMEHKDWMLDKLSPSYDHCKLMTVALKLYNNQKALGKWNPILSIRRNKVTKKKKTKGEPKFLALLIQQLQSLNSKLTSPTMKESDGNVVQNGRGNTVLNWRKKIKEKEKEAKTKDKKKLQMSNDFK